MTLRLMNNPDYIHLLVNPSDSAIAICVCKKDDKDAIKAGRSSSRECEIYSSELMENIVSVCEKLNGEHTYRLTGQLSDNKKMVIFWLNDAIVVEEKR